MSFSSYDLNQCFKFSSTKTYINRKNILLILLKHKMVLALSATTVSNEKYWLRLSDFMVGSIERKNIRYYNGEILGIY